MTFAPAQPDNEFALITAAAPGTTQLRVRRSWVNVPTGGHVSGVQWGDGAARVVFLHDVERSARSFDRVALALGRPSVAIDLPGHGRSSWRRDGRYPPRRLATAVAEAVSSFAPQAELLVGAGLGAQVAVAIAVRQLSPAIRQLALVEPLPGLTSAPRPAQQEPRPPQGSPPQGNPAEGNSAEGSTAPRFGSQAEAADALRLSHPAWPQEEIEREVAAELDQEADGSWAWRHHPGNLAGVAAGDALDPALWADLASLAVPVHALRGSLAGTAEVEAAGLQFIAVPGGGEDPVTLAPAALAATIGGLLAA
jgi:pimeloyl-ACP methyl ester carboxylesterase